MIYEHPIQAGETKLGYGQRVHQDLPNVMAQTNPSVQATYNVQPGQTGPDVVPQSGANFVAGEMKPITGRQGPMVRQAGNWGFDPQTMRWWFYDRDLGLVWEGIMQTEKSATTGAVK